MALGQTTAQMLGAGNDHQDPPACAGRPATGVVHDPTTLCRVRKTIDSSVRDSVHIIVPNRGRLYHPILTCRDRPVSPSSTVPLTCSGGVTEHAADGATDL
ncbi:MAG: hypothetical protein J07HX64_00260 [halophilic archaeon J07HX64]|nr:MAG: hypothetical protein J07HX64_00260 [halophilic archaeon J07HX64]